MYIENIIITKESSSDVDLRLKNKSFSLQFLPECFYDLIGHKHVEYKQARLKIDYLIDIIHSLILKYYFKKENRFALNSVVLKDKYGHSYNYYIGYLVENNILIMRTDYLKGVTSRVYMLNESIFTSKIMRYKNNDKFLLKKYKNKFMNMVHIDDTSKFNLINQDVREKLVSDLFDVKIEYDRAIFYLDALKDENIDIYNRNVYSVDCINDQHIFYHFDCYGRMHTNFTILKSFIRKNCLLIDGEKTNERDLANSQPLFLCKIIKSLNTKWVYEEEFDMFKTLAKNGNLYEYMMIHLGVKNRGDIKKIVYKVLFGRNMGNSKADKQFKYLFPTIHNFIKLYKKEIGDYKAMSHELQRMESNLIFNQIISTINNLHPDIKIITVHDSIVFQDKYSNIVDDIFNQKVNDEFAMLD